MSDYDLAVGDTCASIGGIARVLHPALASPDLEIPTSTRSILSPWGGAVLPASVTAAAMSAFASVLIVASGAVIRDIVQEGSGIGCPSAPRLATAASPVPLLG